MDVFDVFQKALQESLNRIEKKMDQLLKTQKRIEEKVDKLLSLSNEASRIGMLKQDTGRTAW